MSSEITVSSGNTEVGTSSNSNVDAITIDQNMLEALPMFDNDFVATMSQFLDAGSIGNGGVTIVVNGMEVSALNVSASAMAANQDQPGSVLGGVLAAGARARRDPDQARRHRTTPARAR